jgi:hypothetical protein
MKCNERITKEKLNLAIGVIIRLLDQQRTKPIETLLRLEGRRFKIGKGDSLVFERKKSPGESQDEDSPFPRRISIKYTPFLGRYPLFEADVVVAGFRYDSSKLSFLCSEEIKGHSIDYIDEAGNMFQYRFFNNNVEGKNSGFRRQLKSLSDKLSTK